MKVSFPYMGCVTGYKRLMEMLGHEVVMPKKPTQRTIDLGVANSPEFICYPFKVMLGTYIECCEAGAEVIISSGGSGPCRAGLYGELHKKILKKLGYDVEFVIFDSMFEDTKRFFRQLMAVKNKTPVHRLAKDFLFTFKLMCQMDAIEEQIKIKRAYEVNRDDFNKCWDEIVKLHEQCGTLAHLRAAKRRSYDMLDKIEVRSVPESDKIRIGIVGEIYVIMESFTNMNIEQRLNSLGVEVVNAQYISHWLKHNMLPRAINKSDSWKMYDKAEKYKGCNCGGHDMENTGRIIDFAERGFDGVVHLQPFGCLPELVTRSIIPQLSRDLNMPILSVSMDEQLGEANLQTRIEAFVDLCRSKKAGKIIDGGNLKPAEDNVHQKAMV